MTTTEDLQGAARCPICMKGPSWTIEDSAMPLPGKPNKLVVIRCPTDHPYVACGDDLIMAIKHWNVYMAFRVAQEHQVYSAQTKNSILSPCRACLKYTKSDLKVIGMDTHETCTVCKLDKSIKDVA